MPSFRLPFELKRDEIPFALSMFAYFFLVITSFWILKPIKKALFVEFYDRSGFDLLGRHLTAAEAEMVAKMLNLVVAGAAVVAFTWLARRLRRQQLTFALCAFFALACVTYAPLLSHPGAAVVWSFYLYGDLFSTLMVPAFFAFLNDSVSPDAAKRLYGIIGLGGVLGGVAGATLVGSLIRSVSPSGWLWVCAGATGAIAALGFVAGRLAIESGPGVSDHEDAAPSRSAAFEGAALALRSPYLLSIVTIVGLYEIVSTVMDFQFTSSVTYHLDGEAIRSHLATVFAITNVVSTLVQLLLTSTIMTRLGVGVALLVLPAAVLAGSTAFLAFPSLWTGSLLNTADNGFSYSINQSAKEALYVPTSRDEKYKAKAFIDMFVVRMAKTAAVVVSLGLAAAFRSAGGVRWLSLFTMLLMVAWIAAARYAGARFRDRTAEGSGQGQTPVSCSAD